MNLPSRGNGLHLSLSTDYQAMSRRAARWLCAELERRPDLLLCVSAGATPTGTYEELVRCHRRAPGLFARVRILQIDEWGGLPRRGPGTCLADLQEKLLGPLQIGPERCRLFRSETKTPARECERMALWLAAHGPIDICILGLGLNGHIAMNEPGDQLLPHAHVAKLAPSSVHHPMLRGAPRPPRFGLSLGVGDILRSRKVLLLVSGRHKRAILRRVLQPRVTTQLPASLLWLHPDTTLMCDQAALGKSSMRSK